MLARVLTIAVLILFSSFGVWLVYSLFVSKETNSERSSSFGRPVLGCRDGNSETELPYSVQVALL